MDFIEALQHLQSSRKVYREAWQDIDFIFIVNGSLFHVNRAPLLGIFSEGTEINYNPHIDAVFMDGTIGVWSISQKDIFATDWKIKE